MTMETEEKKNQSAKFSSEEFVDYLLGEGVKIPCDETVESFSKDELPPFYDEALFKRGQQFFNDNIFALFFGKLLGLITILSIPSIVNLLIFTNMSSTSMTAYKRYMATLFHMCIWYKSDFVPGSKLWDSIRNVKNLHNCASKRGCTAGMYRISQRDMALTQFGFMGYAVTKREKIGLHNIKQEEWRAFVHIWRVVGYIMGIEDRFSICRESVEETTEICDKLIEKVFRPAVENRDTNFLSMASVLVQGMWAMNPTLNFKVILVFLYDLIRTPSSNNNNNNSVENSPFFHLQSGEEMLLSSAYFVMWSLQFRIFRLFHNYVKFLALWLMKVFPFLAYYKYGYSNSHVVILPEDVNRRRS